MCADQTIWNPIERLSLVETVIDRIRRLMDSGSLPPGSRLPSERELCAQLGVGRSTVRESLRALEALDLVKLVQGKGAFVRELAPEHEAQTDLEKWPVNAWSPESLLETRLAIEGYAAALAAVRRTSDDLDAMERQLVVFEEAMGDADIPSLVLGDVNFHQALLRAANPVISDFINNLVVLGIQVRQTSLSRPHRPPIVLQGHRAIHAAIERQDPQLARRALEDHLLEFVEEFGVEVTFWRWPQPSSHDSAKEEKL